MGSLNSARSTVCVQPEPAQMLALARLEPDVEIRYERLPPLYGAHEFPFFFLTDSVGELWKADDVKRSATVGE